MTTNKPSLTHDELELYPALNDDDLIRWIGADRQVLALGEDDYGAYSEAGIDMQLYATILADRERYAQRIKDLHEMLVEREDRIEYLEYKLAKAKSRLT